MSGSTEPVDCVLATAIRLLYFASNYYPMDFKLQLERRRVINTCVFGGLRWAAIFIDYSRFKRSVLARYKVTTSNNIAAE